MEKGIFAIEFDTRLHHPFTALISGKSMSGKSSFLEKLLANYKLYINGSFQRIIYLYGVFSENYRLLKEKVPIIEFINGIPKLESLGSLTDTLLVIDDLTHEALSNKDICNLFIRGSHHQRVSVFLITHHLFPKERLAREITLNSTYIFILRSCKDALSISIFALHAFGSNRKFFIEAFDRLSKENPFNPVLFDCHYLTPDYLRVRGNFLDPVQTAVIQHGEDAEIPNIL
jgi:hypothetical protein